MNPRLPIVLLSAAALLVLPATAATAGGGHHGSTKPGYSSGPDKGKPGSSKPAPGKPGTPAPAPADLCGGKRAGEPIAWDSYTCEKATGYFLYKKLDTRKPAAFHNSGPQHRVALHPVWAWPSADGSLRHGASTKLPKKAEIIPLELGTEDAAAVCAAPEAYGLQVDLVGNGIAGTRVDLATVVPTVIVPPSSGFAPEILAYYGHYDVKKLVDLGTLCDAGEVVPAPAPEPTPEPTQAPTPTPEPSVTPTPSPEPTPVEEVVVAPEPSPTPTERAEVLPAPAETPTPAVTTPSAPTPTPTATERAEVLSATDDGDTLAATGAQVTVGLLAALAAIAGGAALVLARRRQSTDG
ncbi:LPXTG cell wall anchor domain-containing protein [Cellulomonas sp. zg-ZUI199]|uniref:LPXTG cell wall anchor domain-containing protein n=1 Tax=Cellulomonas wangleii TaxID=2816956 RepID=A0ABX8D4P9_9CELL|nr:LPXTG cell wall anchor domain-containing protein [Cellulomonas wangleii]MBO0924449.1 LPXTG cell wall anchor domain-containing protein [Cellulomonas wangleii]QVI62443.1 LPXTG cell wall anchor domain-containing protein [Cellulomonas wangleii]